MYLCNLNIGDYDSEKEIPDRNTDIPQPEK